MTKTIIEKYQPTLDVWTEISIPNVPSLAAFSWTSTDDGRLIILGGSDGNILTSDLIILNFSKDTPSVQHKNTDFEFSTGMGHLIYREKSNELHHIGGFNSFGVNYYLKMDETNWQSSNFSYTHVISEAD